MTRGATEACLMNIGPRGVSQRRKIAVGAAAIAAAALVTLVLLDLPHRWRALLVVPLWIAALCWMQAAAKT